MRKLKWRLPGQRIIKTSVAVMLCLFYYMLRGYRGEAMPAESAITAIICMQPYMHDSAENARNRLLGTVLGACWGFLFLLVMMDLPTVGKDRLILYPLMGIGTLIALHSAVLLHKEDASGLAAIVFICVVIAYPDIENPLDQAFRRILEVLLGTTIAIAVNSFRLPRIKMRDKVFFLPMKYLSTDQYERLSPAVLFRLQNLYREGANICLMSKHAPTIQTAQLNGVKVSLPMIVMDGAAIYDLNENVYLATTNINPASSRWLMKRLESLDMSYFIYTVHRDHNCIYHHGRMTEREQKVYRYLRRSPYRYYLDDDHFSLSEIVYIKIVASGDELEHIQKELEPMLEKMKLRSVIRPQPGLEDGCSLYFYAMHADMRHAQVHLMRLLLQKNPGLEKCDLIADQPCLTPQDTIRVLRKLTDEYAPFILTVWLRKHRHGRKRHNLSYHLSSLRHHAWTIMVP